MEKRLIKKVIKGDKVSANKLITQYYKDIYTYIYKQTINKEISMDLTQEVFISMLKTIDKFDYKKASFRTWIYKIATYRLVDYYRSKYYKYNKVCVSIENIEIQDENDIIEKIQYKDDAKNIINILNTLEDISQKIFRLKLFGEYTFVEISNMLEMPQSTVKTRYYSTLTKIKNLCKR